MVIKAVNLEGQQEILAVEPMENESEETYSALFRSLQERGLEKVWLCVSDAHKGLQAAIRNTLPGTSETSVICLEEGFEDSVQFYAFEELDSRKISSTNTLERLNREIRRRSAVVGIFPSTDSYIRLITSYLLEYSEDWQTERSYMNAGSIKVQKEILFNAA